VCSRFTSSSCFGGKRCARITGGSRRFRPRPPAQKEAEILKEQVDAQTAIAALVASAVPPTSAGASGAPQPLPRLAQDVMKRQKERLEKEAAKVQTKVRAAARCFALAPSVVPSSRTVIVCGARKT
jgi:hypothetical protein